MYLVERTVALMVILLMKMVSRNLEENINVKRVKVLHQAMTMF